MPARPTRPRPTCCLSFSEGEKPRSALYTCECGGQFEGLKAWREHMVARSMLRKRESRDGDLTLEPPIPTASRFFPSPPCLMLGVRGAVPERITLPGVSKKKKSGGRGSPMMVDGEETAPGREMDTVYINLTKREDRRKLIQGEMRNQGLKGRRFPARVGDEVKDALVARSWHSKLNCLYDKKTVAAEHKMSKGERGCSGSHVALWKQCAKRDDPTKPMLILEDDAVLWDKSGVSFPELVQRLIEAVEQIWDVENEPVMLYVGCEVVQWRDSRRVVVEGPPVMKLREAEYLWQTSSYIIWPAAARELLAHLPVDSPTDCYISKLVLEGRITAVVACPQIAEQRDPYAKGDIKHTNIYKWQT